MYQRLVLGFDPGNSGAIAFYDGKTLDVQDMPTVAVKSGKSIKNRVDAAFLASLLRESKDWDGPLPRTKKVEACIEKVGAMPGQGVTSMFTFGRGVGVLEGVLAGLEIPVSFVSPQTWQKAFQVPKGKDGARARAAALFPKFAHLFARKRDSGRADAALIALYQWGQK